MSQARINVKGTVTAITYPAYGATPNVDVTIHVGSALLILCFMSRRNIDAIDIGQRIQVRGRLTERDGVPVVYNPEYTILPEGS